MIINVKLIDWLLNNDNISGYRISKDSGISQQLLSKYRTGETEVEAMSLKIAKKLSKVAEMYFNNQIDKAVHFIKSETADGVMLSEVFTVSELRSIIREDLEAEESERTLIGDDEDLKTILDDLETYETKYAYVLETADPEVKLYVVPFDFDHMQELSFKFSSRPSLCKLLSDTADLLPDLN